VREVLESLVESYPSLRERIFEGDELPQFLNVFIDGTDVRLNEGLETPVEAGATVVLLPAVAGGESNVATLRAVLDGFNRHDLDAIMSHFADDCRSTCGAATSGRSERTASSRARTASGRSARADLR